MRRLRADLQEGRLQVNIRKAGDGAQVGRRALLPPELFGRENYGAIQGMIATPVRIAMAGAPFAFGALWAWRGSYDAVLLLCLGMAVCSFGAFMLNLALAKEP